MKHVMRSVCEALERDGVEHFVSEGQLTVYIPCEADLKYRKLRPNSIRVCAVVQDEGILIESNLPIRLCASNEKTRREILCLVAKENRTIPYGGLIYKTETQRLLYRAFCFVKRNVYEQDADTALAYIRTAAEFLLEGYQNIANELDSISEGEDDDEMPSLMDDEMDLECLIELQDEKERCFLFDFNADSRRVSGNG